MKLLWCSESWRTVRVSPSPPSRTSWWASRPRSRTACTGTPSTSAPRAPSRAVSVASGAGAVPALRAGLGDELGGAGGGAGRGVHLLGVVQLDDLDGLEVAARRSAANFMVSTAPMEKLGAMSTPVSGEAASQPFSCARRSSVQPVVPTTAWMPCRDAELEVVHHRGRGGQLDGDLGAGLGQRLQLVAAAEGGHQLHVLGGLDGPYRLGADPALGAEDGHAQLAHLLCFLTEAAGGWPSSGVRRPRRAGGRPACP